MKALKGIVCYIYMLVIFFSMRMLGSADLYVINVINNEDPKRYRMLYVYVQLAKTLKDIICYIRVLVSEDPKGYHMLRAKCGLS